MEVKADYPGVKDWNGPLQTVDGCPAELSDGEGEFTDGQIRAGFTRCCRVLRDGQWSEQTYKENGQYQYEDRPSHWDLINVPSTPPVAEAACDVDIAAQGESPDPGTASINSGDIHWHTRLMHVASWLEDIWRHDGISPICAGASKVQLGPDGFRTAFKGECVRKEAFNGFERWSIEHKYAGTPFEVYCDVPNLPVGAVRTEVVA